MRASHNSELADPLQQNWMCLYVLDRECKPCPTCQHFTVKCVHLFCFCTHIASCPFFSFSLYVHSMIFFIVDFNAILLSVCLCFYFALLHPVFHSNTQCVIDCDVQRGPELGRLFRARFTINYINPKQPNVQQAIGNFIPTFYISYISIIKYSPHI